MRRARNWIFGVVMVALIAGVGALVALRLLDSGGAVERRPESSQAPIPVEVAPIERGVIVNRRVLSGTLEAMAEMTVAPKVAGRLLRLPVDLADPVKRGDLVAELDSDEYRQAVMQAEAELEVARANLAEAQNAAEIASRELERVTTLHERGVASDSQLDTVRADQLSKDAAIEVARAQISRAEAALQAARIRLSYTTIRVHWDGADDIRVVAERFVEEGDTVAANTPLLTIIELDPIKVVVFATEREYALLAPGQSVTLRTDAYPGEQWTGEVARISPVFEEGSRQARIEIAVANEDGRLKPGMFARVEAVLGRVEDATIVPFAALTQRGGKTVIFVVNEGTSTVRLTPVETGVREGGRIAVRGEGLDGRVVTLGQQLLSDGAVITIPEESDPSSSASARPTDVTIAGAG